MQILNKMSGTPYYIQISEAYKKMIHSGFFSHGEKLPTLGEVRDMFNVSIKVAAQAYDVLNEDGYIYSRRGKGFFVSHHEKLKIELENIYLIENKLIYEKQMTRHVGLFEMVEVEGYLAQQLALNDDKNCYHIKQFYGKANENVLLQDIYLPCKLFPNLENVFYDYPTLISMISHGYGHKLTKYKNKYFPSQSSYEHKLVLKLQDIDPVWRVESIGCIDDQPLVLINNYLAGEYVVMAVMLSAE